LSLRILGRLRDGYHAIDSVMVPISLCDVLEIRKPHKATEWITVRCDQPDVPSGERNLAYQAAARILGDAAIREAVDIRIHKQIPVGAGLGGGSSDAAATLLGLNQLFHLGYSARKMAKIASRIGADVPFFIYRRAARVRGKGEVVRPLSEFSPLWFVVLFPGFPVSTRWAYQNVSLKLTRVVRNTSIIASLTDCRRLARNLTNDLEAVTLRRYPKLRGLKERLVAEGALAALMSGSGSSVFGIFESEVMARKAFHRLQKGEETRTYLVRSLS
jgi:4-diphosphocytidyl-2-C-methyl-D-erythritol kinase